MRQLYNGKDVSLTADLCLNSEVSLFRPTSSTLSNAFLSSSPVFTWQGCLPMSALMLSHVMSKWGLYWRAEQRHKRMLLKESNEWCPTNAIQVTLEILQLLYKYLFIHLCSKIPLYYALRMCHLLFSFQSDTKISKIVIQKDLGGLLALEESGWPG